MIISRIHISILCVLITFCILPSVSLKSQVTIGKDIAPADFSILQVEYDKEKYSHGGGVQLPRLNAEQIATLEATITGKDNAIGLMIYSTVDKKATFWNGEEWIPVPSEIIPQFSASNGLTATPSLAKDFTNVKLGGDLSQNTEIPLNGQNLTFEQAENATFSVGTKTSPVLTIKNNRVGVNTDNPTALLHIKKDDGARGFTYADGTQDYNRVLTLTNVDGTAEWKNIESVVKKEGEPYKGKAVGIKTAEYYTNQSIECPPGKWLIIAKVNTISDETYKASVNFKYTRIAVKDISNPANPITLTVSGETTEFGGMQVALPTTAFYAKFDKHTTIGLYVTGKSAASKVYPWPSWEAPDDLGYFHAIQLTDRIDD